MNANDSVAVLEARVFEKTIVSVDCAGNRMETEYRTLSTKCTQCKRRSYYRTESDALDVMCRCGFAHVAVARRRRFR